MAPQTDLGSAPGSTHADQLEISVLMTHRISANKHGGVGSFPLVKAGVVNDPLPGQRERLHTGSRRRAVTRAQESVNQADQ